MKKLLFTLLVVSFFVLIPLSSIQAETIDHGAEVYKKLDSEYSYDYDYDYDYDHNDVTSRSAVQSTASTDDNYSTEAGLIVSSLMIFSFLCFGILMVASIIISIWMIVWTYKDAEKRQNPNAALWAVMVFLFGWIAFIVYLFIRKEYPKQEAQTVQSQA